jgi:4-hydroxymandelate synthase
MDIHRIDHVEFFVRDARAAAGQFCESYGFRVHGQLGRPDQSSVLVRQGDILVLLTQGLTAEHPAEQYVARHGDGLATIALAADDPDGTLTEAVRRGAVPLPPHPPLEPPAAGSRVRVAAFGDVAHTFVKPGELLALCAAPDPEPAPDRATAGGPEPVALLDAIDHIAACVPSGELASTTAFYQDVLGFTEIFEEYIQVGDQAMNSRVVQSRSGAVTITLLEPDALGTPGQIDEFLKAHDGAGVQHLALRTGDIATAVRTLSGRGGSFLSTPGSYYDELEHRLGKVGVPVDSLRELSILVDRDNGGELYQIFTRSTHPRQTFFVEVIERLGALTFGTANIRALYEAVERERSRNRCLTPASPLEQ